MHKQTLEDICLAEYPLSQREKVLAAAVLSYLRSKPEQKARELMEDIIQPKLLSLPNQESRLPIVLNSKIHGKRLAVLLDASISTAAEELKTIELLPGYEAMEQGLQLLRTFKGEWAVQSITPEFCAFLLDCYRVLQW